MSFWFINATARAAWAAATSQQAQLEGLRDEWAGQMSVRYYSAADAHLATVTHATPIIDTTTTPYSLRLGAYAAQTDYSVGVAAYCVLAVPAGADIARADCSLAGPGGAVTNPGGRVRLDIGTTLRVQATASLPAADTPAWRTAMTDTDTLYPIGTVTSVLDDDLVWPGGSFIRNMDGGSDGTPAQQHRGWGSSWYVEDVGAFGRFVFGRTGEFSLENQRTFLDISDDAAPWGVWDQPFACLTEAAAASADADFYFNETDYDAIIAARGDAGIVYGNGVSQNTTTWSDSVWDGAFPVCFPKSIQRGWIFRRKLTGNNYGNGVVARYRYNNHCFIPSSWTGIGSGALLQSPYCLGGPFQGSVIEPANLADRSRWHADVWPSGQPKLYLSYQNSTTKARAVISHAAIPDLFYPGSTGDAHCWKDTANKRVYYLGRPAGFSIGYADFSAGISGMTFSSRLVLTLVGSDFTLSDSANSGATDGHPSGRRLVYMMQLSGSSSHLVLLDVDNLTIRTLESVPGLAWQSAEPNVSFAYDAANNRMICVEMVKETSNVYTHVFAIPSDPLTASNYSVTRTLLTKATGATVDGSPIQVRLFGERAKLIESLGVIVLPMYENKPLAFRPA